MRKFDLPYDMFRRQRQIKVAILYSAPLVIGAQCEQIWRNHVPLAKCLVIFGSLPIQHWAKFKPSFAKICDWVYFDCCKIILLSGHAVTLSYRRSSNLISSVPNRPIFCLFSFFSQDTNLTISDKRKVRVLGIRTQCGRMVGADDPLSWYGGTPQSSHFGFDGHNLPPWHLCNLT